MILDIDIPITSIPKIGPKRARLLTELGISTVGDLLTHYPRAYQDRRNLTDLSEIRCRGRETVAGQVVRHIRFGRPKMEKVVISDGKGTASLLFFGGKAEKLLPLGAKVVVSGRAKRFRGSVSFSNFEYEILTEQDASLHHLRIVPLYRLSSSWGRFGQREFRKIVKVALDLYKNRIEDLYPNSEQMELSEALSAIHFPDTWKAYRNAKRRLTFCELFLLQTALCLNRKRIKLIQKKTPCPSIDTSEFFASLSFELTPSQKRVIEEIKADLTSPHPMNRLLQGDVGSGKTVVALWSAFFVSRCRYQTAFMVPTEILADQHYITAKRMLEPLGVKIGILRSGLSQALIRETKDGIREGKIDVVVGTHSLIQEDVEFSNLSFCIIDEQHRFGVLQRQKLIEKAGGACDLLIMTATPIPRTLSLSLYGDMDISTISEMPKGRGKIRTAVRSDRDLPKIYRFVKEEIEKGRKAYFVYPVIAQSDELALKSAEEHFEKIKKIFPNTDVELLHGQLRPDEKENVMQRFAEGRIKILVATTVIEVGIDVPEATIMVIENAERFGLSQLHQLRGRIGRGVYDSYCILVTKKKIASLIDSKAKLSSDDPDAVSLSRLRVLNRIEDGFLLSEYDLRLRGTGELFGLKQHGISELKIADIIHNLDIMIKARESASALLKTDPLLSAPEHLLLKRQVIKAFGNKMNLGLIR